MCYNYVLIVLYLTILDLHLRFFSFTNDIAILFFYPYTRFKYNLNCNAHLKIIVPLNKLRSYKL